MDFKDIWVNAVPIFFTIFGGAATLALFFIKPHWGTFAVFMIARDFCDCTVFCSVLLAIAYLMIYILIRYRKQLKKIYADFKSQKKKEDPPYCE